jgi:hypothetical protein
MAARRVLVRLCQNLVDATRDRTRFDEDVFQERRMAEDEEHRCVVGIEGFLVR